LWVDARLFPSEPRFHLCFELLETESHVRFTEHLTLHVLQLPEISSAFPPAERALYNWGRFFAARDEQALAELAGEDETMATAVKALEELSQDPEARWMARDREDSAHFYRMGLERSRRDGVAEGRAEGRAENQRETIAKLVAALSIELTDAQRASLDDPNTNLDEIQSSLIRERRWP
jgi:flagellar biosynthesis/type III secretory pathway protein FliH